jgi:hypothetical protein
MQTKAIIKYYHSSIKMTQINSYGFGYQETGTQMMLVGIQGSTAILENSWQFPKQLKMHPFMI